MKRLEGKHAFKSVLIVLLALVSFLIVIAIFVKVMEYKKLSYKIKPIKTKINDKALM